MATTGELRKIVEDLDLIDLGDAESILGDDSQLDADQFEWHFPALSRTLEDLLFPEARRTRD